ncbi:uricase [Amylocystis lapponica]|nr:uricase [Amylocystis lapponica]
MSSLSYLSHARYGKDKVRVFRVVREGSWHNIVEYNVTALLEGDIDVSYTKADNSVVVATDSNLAKTSPHILHPERFAIHLGTHLVSKYAHIDKAFITIEKLRWSRIPVKQGAPGQDDVRPHSHSFLRDGEDKRITNVEIDATKGKDKIVASVTSGITDLLVIKTTGSAFENFVRDEYTTLVEVNDRIFSTAIEVSYVFAPFLVPAPQDEQKLTVEVAGTDSVSGTPWDSETVSESARAITLEVFATDESASVQATLYKMAERIIAENAYVQSVTYKLPNKHYIPVDMKYIGVDNLTPAQAEVFVPVSAPSGLISATISRK